MQFIFAVKKHSLPAEPKGAQGIQSQQQQAVLIEKTAAKQRMVVLKQMLVASSILLLRHQTVQLFLRKRSTTVSFPFRLNQKRAMNSVTTAAISVW
jgi:hypothetical protein